MSYNDLYRFVNEIINAGDDIEKYKAELMAALTGNDDANSDESISDIVSLWYNQIASPSELLLGTRYIKISDVAICFVEVALASGLLDGIINFIVGNPVQFGFCTAATIVLALRKFIKAITSLDDCDFCIYMQAVTHYRTHQAFTKKELLDWLPKDGGVCNMHNSKWHCKYLDDNDRCNIISKCCVEYALKSLLEKKILKEETDDIYTYCFEK